MFIEIVRPYPLGKFFLLYRRMGQNMTDWRKIFMKIEKYLWETSVSTPSKMFPLLHEKGVRLKYDWLTKNIYWKTSVPTPSKIIPPVQKKGVKLGQNYETYLWKTSVPTHHEIFCFCAGEGGGEKNDHFLHPWLFTTLQILNSGKHPAVCQGSWIMMLIFHHSPINLSLSLSISLPYIHIHTYIYRKHEFLFLTTSQRHTINAK